MTYKERQELNKLSKQVFGASSKWQKMVTKGFGESFEREREVMVPTRTGVTKKVFTDRKKVIKHYSVEEIKKFMLDVLESRKPKTEEKSTEETAK